MKKRELEKSTQGGVSRDEEAEGGRTKIMIILFLCIIQDTFKCRSCFWIYENISRIMSHCDLNPTSCGRNPKCICEQCKRENSRNM